MRFAVSAATGAAGLLLLGAAVFGQPALYIRQIGQQWHVLMDSAPADTGTVDTAAVTDPLEIVPRGNALQTTTAAETIPVANTPGGTTAPGPVASTTAGQGVDPVSVTPVASAPVVTPPVDRQDDALAQRVSQLQQQVTQLKEQLVAGQLTADQVRQQADQSRQQADLSRQQADRARQQADQARQQLATLVMPQVAIPAERIVLPDRLATPDRPAAIDRVATPDRIVAPARAVVSDRNEIRPPPVPPMAVAERHEAARVPVPPPLPKPKPEPAAVRTEPDDMASVLTRLRQRPGTPVVVASADAVPPAAPQNRAPSPSGQRLAMARTALMKGRIDDARRMLQEVQLQLVFRPVNPSDDDRQASGQSTADVARALGALSSNDTAQSQHYIERAMAAVSGASPQRTDSASGQLAGGYAPAYPPR